MKEIRGYKDFVLFVVYIVFVISIFLQRCSTWWLRHSYCTIPLYCQYFPNLKLNYKKDIHVEVSCICNVDELIDEIGVAVVCGLRD